MSDQIRARSAILEKCPVLGNLFLSAFTYFPCAAPGFSPAARENLVLQTRGWEIPTSASPKQELAFFWFSALTSPRIQDFQFHLEGKILSRKEKGFQSHPNPNLAVPLA